MREVGEHGVAGVAAGDVVSISLVSGLTGGVAYMKTRLEVSLTQVSISASECSVSCSTPGLFEVKVKM